MSRGRKGGGGYERKGRVMAGAQHSLHETESVFRSREEMVAEKQAAQEAAAAEEEGDGEGDDQFGPSRGPEEMSVKVLMWEFGQNDPKRDSGSKLRRLGYAGLLRVGHSFPGVVLSSEAKIMASPADHEIVTTHGIGGINCSWNRLSEIPFGSMGKGRNQRILPLLFAANSVNYGRPYKMNTAEAMAACLYITGFKEDAHILLSPFGYGEEFFRLNFDALEAYAACSTAEQVKQVQQEYVREAELKQAVKEDKRERDRNGLGGGYMDDMDLPPLDSHQDGYWDDEDEEDEEKEEGEGVEEEKKKKEKEKEEEGEEEKGGVAAGIGDA